VIELHPSVLKFHGIVGDVNDAPCAISIFGSNIHPLPENAFLEMANVG
jgi:hypothetical protein